MIRLATFENNSFEPFKTISQESYDLLRADCDVLKKSYTQFVVFKNLQLNLKDYFDFIDKWTNVPAYKIDVRIANDIHFVIYANKLILNVLMSFIFFVDNAKAFTKRNHGVKSQESFILLTNEIYDKSFAYRFLYKLRNYSVHLGFALEVINIGINFNHKKPEISEHSIKLLVDLDLLLKEKKLFGKRVHDEIKEMKDSDTELNLIPLINELSHYIMELQKNIYSFQKEELTNSIENIEMFVGNNKTKTNAIKVYHDIERKGKEVSFSVYDVPYDMLTEFKTTYKNWC